MGFWNQFWRDPEFRWLLLLAFLAICIAGWVSGMR